MDNQLSFISFHQITLKNVKNITRVAEGIQMETPENLGAVDGVNSKKSKGRRITCHTRLLI